MSWPSDHEDEMRRKDDDGLVEVVEQCVAGRQDARAQAALEEMERRLSAREEKKVEAEHVAKGERERLRKLHAARRRADRLEEIEWAVERMESDTYPNNWPNINQICQRLQRALDSREVEGEDGNAIYCKCGHPKWAHDVTGIGGDGYKYGICGVCHECIQYRPVHADEPEGDEQWECPVCYTVVSGKGTNDRVFVCPNADCPQTTVSKADTFRYQPTDEPVSREGDWGLQKAEAPGGFDARTHLTRDGQQTVCGEPVGETTGPPLADEMGGICETCRYRLNSEVSEDAKIQDS